MAHTPEEKSPAEVSAEAWRIYNDTYRKEYEAKYHEQFVAIDITTGDAYRAKWPEKALQKARESAPQGTFHLIRVGWSGAIRVSYTMDHVRPSPTRPVWTP